MANSLLTVLQNCLNDALPMKSARSFDSFKSQYVASVSHQSKQTAPRKPLLVTQYCSCTAICIKCTSGIIRGCGPGRNSRYVELHTFSRGCGTAKTFHAEICVTAHSLIHTGKPPRTYSRTFTTADPHPCIPSRFSDCGSAWTCTCTVLCVSVNSETLEDVCSLGSRRSAAWPICAKTYSQMSKHNHAE